MTGRFGALSRRVSLLLASGILFGIAAPSPFFADGIAHAQAARRSIDKFHVRLKPDSGTGRQVIAQDSIARAAGEVAGVDLSVVSSHAHSQILQTKKPLTREQAWAAATKMLHAHPEIAHIEPIDPDKPARQPARPPK